MTRKLVLMVDKQNEQQNDMDSKNSYERIGDQEDPRQTRNKLYDDAITHTGVGRFHYKLLALCGWALSSDAVEILSVSFILPSASCDLHLSDQEKGWINSIIFIGMMVGGIVWGSLADSHGRRNVLVISLTINALFGLASSLAQGFWTFIAFRFLSGIGVGGSMPVIFSYYAEFQSKDRRGSMTSFLASFWMTGGILAAALAWAIIPLDIGVNLINFNYSSWHIYLSLCILPCLSSAILLILMPESPKYLLEAGKEDDSYEVLKGIFHENHPNLMPSHYEMLVDRAEWSRSANDFKVDSRHRRPGQSRVKNCLRLILDSIIGLYKSWKQLFTQSLRRITVIMIIVFASLSFGYYGLFMWFPELFKRLDESGESVCLAPRNHTSEMETTNHPCNISSTVYRDGLMVAVSSLPGNIFTVIFIDRIGRRILLASSMILSGVSVFFIWFLNSHTQSLIMSCLFGGISIIGWNTLDLLSVELFPTLLRSTASGLMSGIGRIAAISGNLVFGQLIGVNCIIPMVLVVTFLGGGGLLGLFLPELRHVELQ